MREEKIFWELIKIIEENQKKIPKEISEKVEEILEKVREVMRCPRATLGVDYETALSTLKKLLKGNYEKFPKEIQEKMKETLKSVEISEKPEESKNIFEKLAVEDVDGTPGGAEESD